MQDRSPSDVKKPRAAAPDEQEAPSGAGLSRRRFSRGGATAAVILTLANRPALASHCTVSGMLSGNVSAPNHNATCRGLTPGYWKTHPQVWPMYIVGPCNPIAQTGGGTCSEYFVPTSDDWDAAIAQGPLTAADRTAYESQTPGTRFDAVFNAGLTQDPLVTLMQALWLEDLPEHGGPAPILAHSVAALLNALYFGKEAFGYNETEMIDYINQGLLVDPISLKTELEMLNTRG